MEVEPDPSAAVPCHIFAEHDSRTAKCGNGFDFSLQKQTRLLFLRVSREHRYPGAESGLREAAGCYRAQETGSFTGLAGVHPQRAQTGQPAIIQRTNCS